MVLKKTLCLAGIMAPLFAVCGHTQPPVRASHTLAQPVPPAAAQAIASSAAQPVPQTTEDALYSLSQRAGVIFAGQVIAVRRHDGIDGATGIVEIDFAVEDAVRGVAPGLYTLREWAGLWPPGQQPFCVGRRYLVLLHAPGAAGLSSPVGGADGAIPIQESSPATQPAAPSADPGAAAASGGRTVDLRWIAARVLRPLSYSMPAAHPTALPVAAHPEAIESSAAPPEFAAAPAAAAAPESAAQSLPYASALALLRGWEKADHAAQ